MTATNPILYWPRKTFETDEYQIARRVIAEECGTVPIVIFDADITDIFSSHPDATLFYPVFCETKGWWGELLGGDAVVTNKLIISPECQLMAIKSCHSREGGNADCAGQNQLLAAEIYPASGFFKKMNSSVATVSDMLATDSGSILALFSGRRPEEFINILESTGNSYLGCIGRY